MSKALKTAIITAGIILPVASSITVSAAPKGWVQLNGTWYYYSGGVAVRNTWMQDSTGWAFLNSEDGSMVKEGWLKDSQGWCYIKDGYWLNHAAWVKDSTGWQYIGSDGYWDPSVAVQGFNPVQKASDGVALAELLGTSDYVNSAKVKVKALNDALPEKSGLQSRLDAVNIVKKDYDNTFDYSSIEDLIRDNNPTVISNKSTLDKLNLNNNSIQDSIDSMSAAIGGLNKSANEMKTNMPVYTPLTGSTTEDSYINALIANITMINNATIATLESNMNSLQSQRTALIRQQEDLDTTIEKVTVQSEMADDQIVSAAENLIFSYKSMVLEEKKLDGNISSLQRNLEMTKLYRSQGMATDSDVNKIQLNMDNLHYTKNGLLKQKENIKRQLNLMIGKSFDDTAEILFNTDLAEGVDVSSINKDTDMNHAEENNCNIKLQYIEVQTAQTALNRANDDNGSDSSQYGAAQLDLENAQLKYDDVVRTETMKYSQTYEDLMDKHKAYKLELDKLSQEKTNMDEAAVKYNLGMLSKKSLDDENTAYQLQLLSTESAKINLYTTYRKYQWFIKGLSS